MMAASELRGQGKFRSTIQESHKDSDSPLDLLAFASEACRRTAVRPTRWDRAGGSLNGSVGGTLHRATRGAAPGGAAAWRSHATDWSAGGHVTIACGRVAGTVGIWRGLAGGSTCAFSRGARAEGDARGSFRSRDTDAVAADRHGNRSQTGQEGEAACNQRFCGRDCSAFRAWGDDGRIAS